MEPAANVTADAQGPVPTTRVPSGQVQAVLTAISVSQNGAVIAPAGDLERRVLDALAETQLFSKLTYPNYREAAPSDEHIRAKLAVALFPDPHAGTAALKGIAIGASMFLLTPVLPLEYEYAARMTLELEREDGTTHRYNVGAEGSAHYYLFGATHLAADELKAKIVDACLTQLQRELVRDRQFVEARFFAKAAPPPAGTPEFNAIPTLAPTHRPTRTISILRSTPR